MNTFFVSLTKGVFGAITVVTSASLNWPTWVMFIAWVSYYVFGGSLKTASFSFIQILCSVLIEITKQALASLMKVFAGPLSFPNCGVPVNSISDLHYTFKSPEQHTNMIYRVHHILRSASRNSIIASPIPFTVCYHGIHLCLSE